MTALSAQRDAGWHGAARTARILSWVSLLWMTGEGALGLVAGAASGSISLIGWALGSVIEGLASIIVIWRFTGARTLSETAEARAQKAVAVSFFLLAPYIAVESVGDLLSGHQTTTSVLGIVVTSASLLIMPLLGIAKQRLGRRLNSGATAGEGIQNLLCAAQAAAVLIGLAVRGIRLVVGRPRRRTRPGRRRRPRRPRSLARRRRLLTSHQPRQAQESLMPRGTATQAPGPRRVGTAI